MGQEGVDGRGQSAFTTSSNSHQSRFQQQRFQSTTALSTSETAVESFRQLSLSSSETTSEKNSKKEGGGKSWMEILKLKKRKKSSKSSASKSHQSDQKTKVWHSIAYRKIEVTEMVLYNMSLGMYV